MLCLPDCVVRNDLIKELGYSSAIGAYWLTRIDMLHVRHIYFIKRSDIPKLVSNEEHIEKYLKAYNNCFNWKNWSLAGYIANEFNIDRAYFSRTILNSENEDKLWFKHEQFSKKILAIKLPKELCRLNRDGKIILRVFTKDEEKHFDGIIDYGNIRFGYY